MVDVATGSVSVTRDQLLELGRSGRVYEFLNLAAGYLAHVSQDVELRLAEVRAWAHLGLNGVAAECAERLPPELRAHPETAALFERLRRAPSGRLPWESLASRFEANLAAWAARGGGADAVQRAWRTGQSVLELYRCHDGNYQVCQRDDVGRRVWLPRLLDHQRLVARAELPESPPQTIPPPFLIEGVKFGGLITRVWRSTGNAYLSYSPAMYVIEPNPLGVAVAMHLHDWRELLADPRVFLFTGAEAVSRWIETMVTHDDLRLPGPILRLLSWGRPVSPSLEEALERIVELREQAALEVQREALRLYEKRDLAHWARRYEAGAAGEPLRVLMVTSRFTSFLQYSVRDIARALQLLGCEARTLMEDNDFASQSPRRLLGVVCDFQPDMVLQLDHLRCEYPELYPPRLPFVTWIQDMLPNLTSRQAGASVGPYDFVLGHGLAECVKTFGYPPSQFMPCQVPTNEVTFDATPCADETLAPYRCDAAYVGTGSIGPRQMHENFIRLHKLDAAGRNLLETAYEMLAGLMNASPGQRHRQVGRVLAEAAQVTGVELSGERQAHLEANYVAVVADRMYRFQTLEWVADWAEQSGRTFHLYGQGWEQHPKLARYAKGPIENGEPLRRLYQAVSINVHCNLHGTVHQRMLDGLCAGGFFLVRYNVSDFMYEVLRRRLAWMRTIEDQSPGRFRVGEHPALMASFEAYPESFTPDAWPLEFEVSEEILRGAVLSERVSRRSVAGHVFPGFERVTFADRVELFAKAEHFLSDADARREIAREMRERVLSTFTYTAVLRELIGEMAAHFRKASAAGR